MNIFMDADAAADVLGQTTPQGMVDASAATFKAGTGGLSLTAGRKGTSLTVNCQTCPLCTKMVQINPSPMHQVCRGGCVVTQWRLFDS